MKQVSHRGYLLVEVPEDATDFYIVNYDGINVVYDVGHRRGFVDISIAINMRVEKTNTGNFLSEEYKTLVDFIPEIIGKGNEITEEVWEQMVDRINGGYECYDRLVYGAPYSPMETVTKSGFSLISSAKMKPETTLILKLKTNE